jgi:quercetin dioxygenase-like cupin family protein
MTTEGFAKDDATIKEVALFNLAQEINNPKQKRPWPAGHIARTLLKRPDLRMVLIIMDKNSVLKEHHVDGTISVHVLKGRIRLTAQGEVHELQTSEIVTLSAAIKHDVEALDDSAFLITIAWPDAEKLQAMKHRGYGS